jgi:hypothetical protein
MPSDSDSPESPKADTLADAARELVEAIYPFAYEARDDARGHRLIAALDRVNSSLLPLDRAALAAHDQQGEPRSYHQRVWEQMYDQQAGVSDTPEPPPAIGRDERGMMRNVWPAKAGDRTNAMEDIVPATPAGGELEDLLERFTTMRDRTEDAEPPAPGEWVLLAEDLVADLCHYYETATGQRRPLLAEKCDRLERELAEARSAAADETGRLQRELRGVRESLAERDQACEDAEARAAMYRARLGERTGVPGWAVTVLGPAESSLRVLDAIAGRSSAGESRESVADDYGVPVEFVDRVVAEWPVPEADEE